MTPEGRVEAYLVARVKATGGQVRKLRWVGRRGAPDRFVWWPGPLLALVELKRPKRQGSGAGQLSSGQGREIARLRADGFRVFVLSSTQEVDGFIQALTQPDGCTI